MEDHVFKQSVPATISNYLLKTSGAESLANFSLVAGLQWTGQGGGGGAGGHGENGSSPPAPKGGHAQDVFLLPGSRHGHVP